MPEFLHLRPPVEARDLWLEHITHQTDVERVPSEAALGRVTAEAIRAPHDLPPFDRSTVDGYAVRAADTYGASESLPAYLRCVGEVPMGAEATVRLARGECALIHTGGMLPAGADAVVMVEHTQVSREDEVEVLRAVAVAENVIRAGEDVRAGEEVIPAGVRLRPAEIGGLMALGLTSVLVRRPPRVGVISTGDEVVPPDTEPRPGQVRDVNSYTLAALIRQLGGEPVTYGILPDDASRLEATTREALAACDAVVITAGSSASVRDLTASVINRLGSPGVLVHGVNVRPGKPTILAVCDGKPVVGLPGNPVSALVIAGLFLLAMMDRLCGVSRRPPAARVVARLTVNLASQTGREDWVPVRLIASEEVWLADPVFYKSNLIFTLTRADGLVRIPPEAGGLSAGAEVEVVIL